jgi:addiction module HigA family antidote
MTKHNPVHPGFIVKHECIDALDMTIADAARALDISRQHLHRICTGQSPIVAEMALRLEQVFGSTAQTWLAMQAHYDLAQLEHEGKIHLRRIKLAA